MDAQSRRVYMGATELGGGERVLLEARACGVPSEAIELEADNNLLREFLDGPIYTTEYYADQLARGIRDAIEGCEEAPSRARQTEPFKVSVL